MGRRALPKIDPSLDLAFHLRLENELPERIDDQTLFGRQRPWELEIGSGKGLFLRTAAAADPHRDWVGIEIARKYARHAAAGLARASLTNACCISGDARRIVAERVKDATVSGVHVYFPDPWWKKRHLRRRIMNEQFVAEIQRILIPGSKLHFWTDVHDYFEAALEVLEQFPQLRGPLPVEERAAEHDLDYRTHFERRMRLHREAVYRSEFIRL
ncbi:MAG: tRNA (guanosine(46)-N7)-methyltransferase TrmB [Pirellulales bacterium]